jgi:hypothetical protein
MGKFRDFVPGSCRSRRSAEDRSETDGRVRTADRRKPAKSRASFAKAYRLAA